MGSDPLPAPRLEKLLDLIISTFYLVLCVCVVVFWTVVKKNFKFHS